MLFLVLILFKIYVLIWKKGISKFLHQVAAKHTAPNVEIKNFNVLIDGKNFFDLPVKNEEEA